MGKRWKLLRTPFEREDGNWSVLTTQDQYVVVSPEWKHLLFEHNWYAEWDHKGKTFYVRTNIKGAKGQITKYIHQLIIPDAVTVDHADHNGLNNTNENISASDFQAQILNQRVSSLNTSGYKGVSWHKASGKWIVGIASRGKYYYGGLFEGNSPPSAPPQAAIDEMLELRKKVYGSERSKLGTVIAEEVRI